MKRSILTLSIVSSLALGCAKVPEAPSAEPAPANVVATAPSAAVETLTVDPATSKVAFVGAKVTATHDGGFRDVSGTIRFDSENVLGSSIEMRVATASIFTDNERLTTHLSSPDFFDVAQFPEATFRSTAITAGGSNGATHTVVGDLTLHGQTKSVALPVTLDVQPGAVSARSEVTINRRDYGLVYPGMPDDLIRDEVVLRVELRAPRASN